MTFVPFAFASAFSPFANPPTHTHTHSCTRLNPCKEIISKQWLATAPSTECLVSAQSTQNDTDKYHTRDSAGQLRTGHRHERARFEISESFASGHSQRTPTSLSAAPFAAVDILTSVGIVVPHATGYETKPRSPLCRGTNPAAPNTGVNAKRESFFPLEPRLCTPFWQWRTGSSDVGLICLKDVGGYGKQKPRLAIIITIIVVVVLVRQFVSVSDPDLCKRLACRIRPTTPN